MSVMIRMSRTGRNNRPFFRIGAYDRRAARDGPCIERLGHWDPLVKDDARAMVLDRERVVYWLSQGARPSVKMAAVLRRLGISKPEPPKPAPAPEAPPTKPGLVLKAEKKPASKASKSEKKK
ncbi:MAG: 30S ribosomal protein S16 [Planctomycetales bacterium]|nr:30S ribosomal protein S16 [Planctomycetales bacterium]